MSTTTMPARMPTLVTNIDREETPKSTKSGATTSHPPNRHPSQVAAARRRGCVSRTSPRAVTATPVITEFQPAVVQPLLLPEPAHRNGVRVSKTPANTVVVLTRPGVWGPETRTRQILL